MPAPSSPVDADCDACPERRQSCRSNLSYRWSTRVPLPANNAVTLQRAVAPSRAASSQFSAPKSSWPRCRESSRRASWRRTTGAVEEIHLLTTTDVSPKQTVRNVESALIAHLGMRVSHKKISVATSDEATRPKRTTPRHHRFRRPLHRRHGSVPYSTPVLPISAAAAVVATRASAGTQRPGDGAGDRVHGDWAPEQPAAVYFEDVEVRRSRGRGSPAG